MSTRLALALDCKTREELVDKLEKIQGKDLVVKVGLKTLPLLSPKEWKPIFDKNEVFVDAKLHDIPDQVFGAVKTWAEFGAKYITIHTQGGSAMIESALEAASSYNIRVLGVSVLTSIGDEDLKSMGLKFSVAEYVESLVQNSINSGLYSFVSSVFEVESIRTQSQSLGQDSFHVCPGISFGGHVGSDQKRVVDLSEAKSKGVDLAVMGRSITTSPNFVDTIAKVLDELRS